MSKAVNQKELFSGDHTVYWPDKYETVVEYLKNGTGSSENSNSLYKLNVHVIVLAACVGLLAGEKLSIPEKEKRKEIPISVFNNHDLSIFLYLIPLLINSSCILLSSRRFNPRRYVREYACEASSELAGTGGSPL